MTLTVLIASTLESKHVQRIRQEVPGVEVLYEPTLLAPPRFEADHSGDPAFRRTAEQEQEYRALLAQADVLFDFDRHLSAQLPQLAPKLKWIQATSSGIGPFVRQTGLDTSGIIITNAAGIHAVPLAEHALLAMIYFTKDVTRLQREQGKRRWERYCGKELRGMTVGVVGLGAVGSEVARLARAVGLKVLGVKRDISVTNPSVDELFSQADLDTVLPRCDFLVLILPHTKQTENMLDARRLALLPKGAILINIARGAVVDEDALIEALQSGHLGGAALDVARVEPMPKESPLWLMENVLISPHSASTVDRENERLTDLFIDNLHRYMAGRPLVNLFTM
jgi:glyoxylate/hydroxypyruvate reductase A